jgi:ferric-dicitrate binding protein FerR (iron transport regulator)
MESFDKIFESKLKESNVLPSEKWNENIGWAKYSNKYAGKRYLNIRTIIVGVASLAATIALFIGVNYYLRLQKEDVSVLRYSEVQLQNNQYVAFRDGAQYKYKLNAAGGIDTLLFEGECYIEASNSNIIVLLNNSVITGQNANISIKALPNDNEITISVLKGAASIRHAKLVNYNVSISAGEQCVYDKQGLFISKEVFPDSNFLAWKTGRLVFSGTPLCVVAEKLADYYKLPIEFKDTAAMLCQLTSVYDKRNITDVMNSLKKELNLQFLNKNGRIQISGGNCLNY